MQAFGSSPRARGAGRGGGRLAIPSPVHPRVRGEQSHHQRPKPYADGSSPRARGAVIDQHIQCEILRFIPACAGSSLNSTNENSPDSVHPRVRGEQAIWAAGDVDVDGSSPRARGADEQQGSDGDPVRFIPACAGSRRSVPYSFHAPTVHPRVRGEQSMAAILSASMDGSSPRARGAGITYGGIAARGRFIPACAGSSR